MGCQPPVLDFALIGHQESWSKVSGFLHAMRGLELDRLPLDEIRDIFAWIPPRVVFRIEAKSVSGKAVRGAYIETFIPPDQLAPHLFRNILRKVQQAAACAHREGARLSTLGGFTSIVLEGKTALLEQGDSVFTTGNTLTSAFIVKGMERAAALHGLDLKNCQLLIIGATGDIGSACAGYFSGKVRKLLLCARNELGLARQAATLEQAGFRCEISTDLKNLLPLADLIISAASSAEPAFPMEDCQPHALICDAGFPKNILAGTVSQQQRLWHGGMGQVLGGVQFEPDYSREFYDYPAKDTGHGCLLESVLLAMEGRFESFSKGRGCITPEKIEEIWTLAQKHGLAIAPFFNETGLWRRVETNQQA